MFALGTKETVMFRLMGIRLHPAVRALLGIALAAIGLWTQRPGLAVIGGVFVAWAIIGAIAPAKADRAKGDAPNRYFR